VNQGTVSPENYWWSVPGVFIASQSRVAINNTLLTVTTTLQPDQWSHALGTNGSVIQDKFLLALSQIKQVGLAFGGGSFYDVGVNQYYATFKLKSFSIQ
jgi:hypothetical protein